MDIEKDPLAPDVVIMSENNNELMVKEEINDESTDSDIEFKSKAKPIVYTTKLDDMWVFKEDVEHLSTKEITDCIINESKPQLSKSYTRHENRSLKHCNTIDKMLRKLYKLNIKARNERTMYNIPLTPIDPDPAEATRERNRLLLKQCKPCSIVLESIQVSFMSSEQNSRKEICSIDISDDESIDTLIDFQSVIHKREIRNAYLLWYEMLSKELDIYYIDNNDRITEHCVLKGQTRILDRVELFPYIGNTRTLQQVNCCWFARAKVLKSIWPKIITSSSLKFMRKPLRSDVGKCEYCSCKLIVGDVTADTQSETQYSSTVLTQSKTLGSSSGYKKESQIPYDDNEIQHLEQDISNALMVMQTISHTKGKNDYIGRQQLLSSSNSDSLIDKALRYDRPTCKLNQPTFAVAPTQMGSTNVLYLLELGLGKCAEVDYYEVGENGDLLSYSKTGNVMCKVKDLSNVITHLNICCWVKREEIISSTFDDDNPKLKMLKNFMRRPHLCPIGKCKCCCYVKMKRNIPSLVQIDLNKFSKKLQVAMVNSVDTKQKTLTRNPVQNTSNTMNDPRNIVCTPKRKMKKDENVTQQPNIVLPGPVTDYSQKQQVDSLISTILDRFKDVRLTINEDGKVAAALPIPVNSLSTAELKVLSKILAHAQEQVKALGLRPGTNLDEHIRSVSKTGTNTVQANSNPTSSQVNSSYLKKTLTPPSSVTAVPTNNIMQTKPFPSTSSQINTSNIKETYRRPGSLNSIPETNVIAEKNLSTDPYASYSELISKKSEYYVKSLSSHIYGDTFKPIIESVFSMKDDNGPSISTDSNNKSKSDAPKILNSRSCVDKRKSVEDETSTRTKIRVMSPSRLAIVNSPSNPVMPAAQVIRETLSSPQVNTLQSPVTMIVKDGNIQLIPHVVTPSLAPQTTQISDVVNPILQQAASHNYMHLLQKIPANSLQSKPQPTRVMATDNVAQQTSKKFESSVDFIPSFVISKHVGNNQTTRMPHLIIDSSVVPLRADNNIQAIQGEQFNSVPVTPGYITGQIPPTVPLLVFPQKSVKQQSTEVISKAFQPIKVNDSVEKVNDGGKKPSRMVIQFEDDIDDDVGDDIDDDDDIVIKEDTDDKNDDLCILGV